MKINKKIPKDIGVVVVAQLVERLLPTPEVPDSNPVIMLIFYLKDSLDQNLLDNVCHSKSRKQNSQHRGYHDNREQPVPQTNNRWIT